MSEPERLDAFFFTWVAAATITAVHAELGHAFCKVI